MAADAAAWAQAYLSAAAILASGAVAVFVPWNERRIAKRRSDDARLAVECRRSKQGGLELVFTYQPEFRNFAVGVSVYVMEPIDARVYKGKIHRIDGAEGYAGFQNVVGALGQNVRYNAVSLHRTDEPGYSQDVHRGVMFVEYPDEREGPFAAKVKINILAHGNHLVSTKTMRLSAIDDEYYGRGGPIAVIAGGA